ncbi:MAG: hypothetical protein KGQ37_06045 [Hyphomicrobiales bacterium]|nr:hypothetical protein [Hyphomicrobiales bacterium]
MTLLTAGLIAAVVPCSSAFADDFASPWVAGAGAKARLIVAGGPVDGVWRAAVDISLDPGETTYWRSPGETGVPPDFNFQGSVNVRATKVSYPAPHAITEAGNIEAFGYQKRVLFPFVVTPAQRGVPTKLHLTLNYAACATICAPLRATLDLALPQQAVSSPYAAEISRWQAQVPARLTIAPEKLAGAVQRLKGTGKPAWRLEAGKLGVTAQHLFVEPPDGYYVSAKADGAAGAFRLVLRQAPASPASALVPVRFTATAKNGAVEWRGTLDAGAAKP